MSKAIRLWVVCCMFILATVNAAFATTTNFAINDIGTFTGYQNSNAADTYSGTGFVGLYDQAGVQSFGHLFGMEANFSKTNIQVDISSLQNQTINSAFLNFAILDGFTGSQNAQIISFETNGILGYNWNPTQLGVINRTVNHLTNSIDITSFVTTALANDQSWLGLQLAGLDTYQWTYTYGGYGYGADRAQASLSVDSSAPVPEPSTFLLLGAGLVGIGLAKRRKKA